ncbi:MAG: 30S ribosomal protein S9 [Planctomycetota bacterium]|jgi:small subunit ribosomal protein S9
MAEQKAQSRRQGARASEQSADRDSSSVLAGESAGQTQSVATFVAADPPQQKHYWWGTGRRKRAVARVRIRPGTGKFLINKREVPEYFAEENDRQAVVSPLDATKMHNAWDVWANVTGGGSTGQAGAVVLGLARAIARAVPEAESVLRNRGLLTRDARMRERKKYGQPGARKRFQFSKR